MKKLIIRNLESLVVKCSFLFQNIYEENSKGTSLLGIFLEYNEFNPNAYTIFNTTNNKIYLYIYNKLIAFSNCFI